MPGDGTLPALRLTHSHISSARPNVGPYTAIALENDALEDGRVPGPTSDDSGDDSCLAVASGNHVELLNDKLHLRSTLLFADAFPTSVNRDAAIRVLAADRANGRLAAASEDSVAIWSKNGSNLAKRYRVHSAFSTSFPVECLELCEDILLAGGTMLAAYKLNDDAGFPTWSRKLAYKPPRTLASMRVTSNGEYVACSYKNHHVVQLFRLTDSGNTFRLDLLASPWHPQLVHHVEWLPPTSSDISNSASTATAFTLLTQTKDGVSRFWRCLSDEPNFFVLWATVDPGTSVQRPVLASYWFPGTSGKGGYIISVHSDGTASRNTIRNLDRSAETVSKVSFAQTIGTTIAKDQLSCLRYSVPIRRKPGTALFGIASSGSFALCHLSDQESGTTRSTACRRGSRMRPKQAIALMQSTLSGNKAVTAGNRGELLLWSARRLGNRTARMDVVARYSSDAVVTVRHLAISNNREVVLSVTESHVALFKRSGSALDILDVNIPSTPAPGDILTAAVCSVSEEEEYIVMVDNTGQLYVWLADPNYAKVTFLYQSIPALEATLASVAKADTEGINVHIVMANKDVFVTAVLTLEGRSTSSRTSSPVPIGRKAPSHVAISAANYVAIIDVEDQAQTLTIYNAQSSLFTSPLEYSHTLEDKDTVLDIAFVDVTSQLPVLIVTTQSRVSIVSQRRMDYYKENTLWIPFSSTVIVSPYPISAACPVWASCVFVATSAQTRLLANSLDDGCNTDLIEAVKTLNEPLPDYFPQLLAQLLLADKGPLVDKILSRLQDACVRLQQDQRFDFATGALSDTLLTRKHERNESGIYHTGSFNFMSEDDVFPEDKAESLLRLLPCIPGLSQRERSHLEVIVTTVMQVRAQRRALDVNGMRFLISLRSFAITQGQVSQTPQPSRPGSPTPTSSRNENDHAVLSRLRYRDVLWGYHSESQDILLTACNDICGSPMMWADARALGLALWVRSPEVLATQLEAIARNEYRAKPDEPDPTSCSLFYFALRKKRLVQGLWRQATFHKERNVMLKFLLNDFTEPRWKSAALKNAYALMSKQRFSYAAAFFLLGDSLKDCVNVCLRQLQDFHLAVMLARVYEGDDGPTLKYILNTHVLPFAFGKGHRRLASWAFWLQKRRDLAVQVLVSPLAELAPKVQNSSITEIGNPTHEDPTLVLLFSQLRDWSLQTLQGSYAISPIRETQFILHIANILTRMGCHILAVDLVANWSFRSARDQILALAAKAHHHPQPVSNGEKTSSLPNGRPIQHRRRRSSLLAPKRRSTIILDVPSTLPSRSQSPEPDAKPSAREAAEDKEGFRKVVREVKAPPPEFDMDAFGF